MKNICIVTSSRADYGLLKPLMLSLENSKLIKLSIFVTGTHLSKKYGKTLNEIISDGFKIDKKIKLPITNDSAENITKCLGHVINQFGKLFNNHSPDAVLILGDRYEILGVACAATLNRIPIIHVHGGEKTLGAYDDAFRHAISKMSVLHFVSNLIYKKRLIQLGENKKKIHVVGALGIENIKYIKRYSKKNLIKYLKINFANKNLLITFHPVTLEKNKASDNINQILLALDTLKDTNLFFTMSNSDNESDIINIKIKSFVKKNKNAFFFKSLGLKKYISLLSFVDAIIGNSSSGIIEAPFLKIPTLNIGNRQKGRLTSKSIITVNPKKNDILKGIKKIYTYQFKSNLKKLKNLYGNGTSSKKILKILESPKINLDIQKDFIDLPLDKIKINN